MIKNQRIEHLVKLVQHRIPNAMVAIDAPLRASGPWFIDVSSGDQSVVVEFRSKLGFGLSSPTADSFGEGPDEFFEREEDVVERVLALVRSRQRTSPQRVHLLQELREQRHVSQVALATRLGIGQPSISKTERREDVALSTLRRYVEALGGTLHVTVQFADALFEIALDDTSLGTSG